MPQTLLVIPGAVAEIRLNRPDKRNAFDETVIRELHEAVEELGADAAVRAIVLRGEGAAFSAGADLGWMRRASGWSEAENRADAFKLARMLRAVAECPKPVIARVHGAAMGGGVGLAAAADVCLVGPEGFFMLSEVKLGLIPATIAPHVVAAIGPRAARRYVLTAERIDPAEALRLGLAHQIFATDPDMDAALQMIARAICANAPGAVAESKRLIRAAAAPLSDALLSETADWIARLRVGDEAREGLAAFFDKRKPGWVI